MKRAVAVAVVVLLLIGTLISIDSSAKVDLKEGHPIVPLTKPYTQHSPIRINSDLEFNTRFSNRTIYGLNINGTEKGCCIFIGNCSQPFTIKNCILHNATGMSSDLYYLNSGIYLCNCSNGTISFNLCDINSYGITIRSSNNNTISNNTCIKNGKGIYLWHSIDNSYIYNKLNNNFVEGFYMLYSDYNLFFKNNCSYQKEGFWIDSSNNNTLSNNICINNVDCDILFNGCDSNKLINNMCIGNDSLGIGLYGSLRTHLVNNKLLSCSLYIVGGKHIDGYLSSYTSHVIGSDNTIDNKPIYYLKNQTYLKVPQGAGQIILANCSHISVENQSLNNQFIGLLLAFSNNCTIENNNFSANKYGIRLIYQCDGNVIANNTISNNMEYGVYIEHYSNRNIITNNKISHNRYYGVCILEYCNYNRIHHNNFFENNYKNSDHAQAIDVTGTNFWNTSTEGNYWSDWTGPDDNHDGIVDIPYSLDKAKKVKDSYPLIDSITGTGNSPLLIYLVVMSFAIFIILIAIVIIRKRKKKKAN